MKTTIKILFVILAVTALQPAWASINCSVTTDYGSSYNGSGYDEGSALDIARNACILAEHNSYVCMQAQTSCYDDSYSGGDDNGSSNWGQSTCTVSTQYGEFYGNGYDVGAALADARDQCIRAVGNSYVCVNAHYTCKQ